MSLQRVQLTKYQSRPDKSKPCGVPRHLAGTFSFLNKNDLFPSRPSGWCFAMPGAKNEETTIFFKVFREAGGRQVPGVWGRSPQSMCPLALFTSDLLGHSKTKQFEKNDEHILKISRPEAIRQPRRGTLRAEHNASKKTLL